MESTKKDSTTKYNADIKIYDTFDENLVKNWNDLYFKGANFHLSYEWCSIWFKYFNKNRKLQIITIWDNNELKLLAPFYLEKDKLYLIGSIWDYINEFDLLYDDEKYLNNLLDYLIQEKIDVHFKYLNSETSLGRFILKKYVQNGIKCVYEIKNTKPYLEIGSDFKIKSKADINRCKNAAKKIYNEDIAFDFITEKSEDFLNEFIDIHKKRWNGGIFKKEPNLDLFIKEIYSKTNLASLSRLYLNKSNKSVAYCFNYFDSKNKLWVYQPANNSEYIDIGPGKVQFQYIVENAFKKGIKKIDFGLGSQDYKYRFANKDTIVFDFITFNNNKIGFKFKRIADKIINKTILDNSILKSFSKPLAGKASNFW